MPTQFIKQNSFDQLKKTNWMHRDMRVLCGGKYKHDKKIKRSYLFQNIVLEIIILFENE